MKILRLNPIICKIIVISCGAMRIEDTNTFPLGNGIGYFILIL